MSASVSAETPAGDQSVSTKSPSSDRETPRPVAPTEQAYGELQSAFDHFNFTLFVPLLDHAMPTCLITLQRERRTRGYFSSEQFVGLDGTTLIDEIAMNPSYFAVESIEDVLSTLVHEMVHGFQYHYGSPGRGRYHNKEWAVFMEKLGLMPSSTGRVGGKRVGEHMDHYILDGGPFYRSCADLITQSFRLSWFDRYPPVGADDGDYVDLDDAVDLDNDDSGLRYYAAPLDVSGDPDASGDGEADASGHDAHAAFVGPPSPPSGMLLRKAILTPGPAVPPSGIVFPTGDEQRKSHRSKYRCPGCGMQLWGKPGLKVLCGHDSCGQAPLTEL
ncbi:SprT-like domain-containing protein [Acidithiobacillus marinus]|uniref:SprT-like domain-containing protein n=1 Tax=Acidithiobacillus marinus TaxID=187490 RepID=UPI00117B1944|nr:SprT-like domain-containing protein [Acidithiobacillus marinus]